MRGRVDNLEAQTAQLEANQFSTTTKLTGQAVFDINGGTSTARNVKDPNIVFISRIRLNFNTSFTGKDTLLAQLQAGTNGNGTFNAPAYFAGLGTFSGIDFAFGTPNVFLNRLNYSFPVAGKDLQAVVFLAGFVSDYVDINSYANIDTSDFSASWDTNDYLVLAGDRPGAGLVLTYNPAQGPVTFTVPVAEINDVARHLQSSSRASHIYRGLSGNRRAISDFFRSRSPRFVWQSLPKRC
jgi:hypothetical protein